MYIPTDSNYSGYAKNVKTVIDTLRAAKLRAVLLYIYY